MNLAIQRVSQKFVTNSNFFFSENKPIHVTSVCTFTYLLAQALCFCIAN
jgi:hypothetical protein